ncbi:MAG: hypothetical protein IPL65_21885 [Lewinellaceae bacterium]|nr:hypothetical protein [Lewinellaceae bacterium]
MFPYERYYVYKEFYWKMIVQFPDRPEWRRKLGLVLYDMGQRKPDENIDRRTIEYATLESVGLLRGAIWLDPESGVNADLHQKLGSLSERASFFSNYYSEYEDALALRPTDADLQSVLIAKYAEMGRYLDAQRLLDSLNKQGAINFSNRLLLAAYTIRSGDYARAETILREAKDISPFVEPKISELESLLYQRSGQYRKAIDAYGEWTALSGDSASKQYSLARVYALMKDSKNALLHLETAGKLGFPYPRVLEYDPVWKSYRERSAWKALVGQYFSE